MQKASFAPTPGDLVELLKEATNQGCTIMVLPSQHRHELPLTTTLRLLFGLRPAESRALAALVQRGYGTREELHAVMSYDDNLTSSSKIVDVTICRLRRKLALHGIGVTTIWGSGYALDEEARDKTRKLLAGHGADIADATAPPVGQANHKKTKAA